VAAGLPEGEEAEQMMTGFRLMLEATSVLVAYNFQRAVLSALQAQLEAGGSEAERAVLAREVHRHLEATLPA